ncbi:hypothetical protein VTI74DRAFT_11480 [Chaetomium olivicolor]
MFHGKLVNPRIEHEFDWHLYSHACLQQGIDVSIQNQGHHLVPPKEFWENLDTMDCKIMFARLVSQGKPKVEGGAPTHEADEPWGLKVWVPGNDPSLDIVAIRGLNGHRENTWALNGRVWLRDFLPEHIPNVRIMTWGYDARTHNRTEISRQLLYDHAINLIQELILVRRPTAIFVSMYSVLLVGTPHQGGEGVAWGKRLAAVASVFTNTNNTLLEHLERNSEFLQSQLGQYLSISDQFVTKFAYETLPTPLPVGGSIMSQTTVVGRILVALTGAYELVKELLDSGEDPDLKTANGLTPLHTAASSGNVAAVRLLLAAGADKNAVAGPRLTPLWRAAEARSVVVVEELLKHSPSIDLPNIDGQTPLIAAAVKGHVEILGMLLDAGAYAHVREYYLGWTALHKSASTIRLRLSMRSSAVTLTTGSS